MEFFVPQQKVGGSSQATAGPVGKPPQPQKPAKSSPFSLVILDDPSQLAEHLPAWEALADVAIEPNPFYAPSMLLPALQAYRAGPQVRFLLFYTPDPERSSGPPLLCGFFPVQRKRSYKSLSLAILAFMEYPHCRLGIPLLRPSYAHACLEAFFDWAAEDKWGAPIIQLRETLGDGPLHEALVDLLYDRNLPLFTYEHYTRPLLRPHADPEEYLRQAMSGEHRSKYRQKERKLTNLGDIEYLVLKPEDDITPYLEAFLKVEASGWKGRGGSAMHCAECDRRFFLASMQALHTRGRAMMLTLSVGGKPVACKCNILSPPGSFAFKIAFDEDYRTFSPGALLELENLRRVHSMPAIQWMDSYSRPEWHHFFRWLDCRTMHTSLISTGRWTGDFLVSALPMLRWMKRRISRRETSNPSSADLIGASTSADA